MPELEETKKSRRGLKITLIALLAVGVVGGVVGAATANSLGGGKSDASSTLQSTSTGAPTVSATPSPAATPALPLEVSLAPKNGATFVNPVTPIVAQVKNGTVFSAVLKESTTGANVDGTLSSSETKWQNSAALKFNTDYTFDVTTIDTVGNKSTTVTKFTTVPTSNEADLVMFPASGSQVGVAQPIQFTFSEPVTNKAAVEKAINIQASSGQKGAFRWYSDTMVRYRAENFWAAGTKITVNMKLLGVDFGNGQIGNFNKTNVVQIGNKVEMVADAANHVANVFINDKLVKTYPVTMGDERFPSASGYLVILSDKQRYAHFVASTIGLKPGDPADYGEVDVEYATRLTPSGEFIHQATASALPYVGITNLSHGCIGMTAEGASWVFANMNTGDLVHVVGSPNETIAPTDGFGDWNIPWAQYASR